MDKDQPRMPRITISSGMISTSQISCSRMLIRRMKCVGTPMSFSRWKTYSEIRLLRTPLPFDNLMLLGVERGRVILEILDKGTRAPGPHKEPWLCLHRFVGGGSLRCATVALRKSIRVAFSDGYPRRSRDDRLGICREMDRETQALDPSGPGA